jgi:pimeloyl-ACP methyl ester carboxylesterase
MSGILCAMAKATVVTRVLNGDRLECRVVSPQGSALTLSGQTSDVEPDLDGSDALGGNRALVHNAWAFAKFTHLKVSLPTQAEQKNAEKRAKGHHKVAEWIAALVDDPAVGTKEGWCSACFAEAEHQKVNRPVGQLPIYLCTNCGAPTLPCAGPRCRNMAVRERGGVRVPRYCAEHRHEIPGFEKADLKMGSLGDYDEFLKYDKRHLGRVTKIVGVGLTGLALGAPAALFAAPAIGGAVGTLIGGYTGAAATSYGLALLGGGSLAAGGLGMAGGTIVVSALGGALGGALGASVTNAYVREDKSFHIEMLQGGPGVPVVVCNGFLSESGRGWGEWKEIVTTRYPDSPVYRVHWGAKELKHLGILAGYGSVKVAGPAAIKKAAAAATKEGARLLGPLSPVLLAAGFAKNPWHVAKNRADKTGVIVADLLARTSADSYVLVGHSLGARAMAVAAQTLGTKKDGPRVEAAHLTGAAIGAESDWTALTARVNVAVYNYFSENDKVLKYLYAGAQLGQKAAGRVGFTPCPPNLHNVDTSECVERHSDYYTKVTFR